MKDESHVQSSDAPEDAALSENKASSRKKTSKKEAADKISKALSKKVPVSEARADDEEEKKGAGPSVARVKQSLQGSSLPLTIGVVGLFVLASFYTLYAAASFFLPVVLAVIFNFLFSPVVRTLERLHIPTPLGAGLVVLGFIGGVALGIYQLSGPASEWIEKAPDTLRTVEYKLRGVKEAAQKVKEATQQVEQITGGGGEAQAQQQVQVQQPTLSDTLLDQTTQMVAGTAVLCFLLYFLLASGDLFLRKLVHVLPMLRRKRIAVKIAFGIERDLSAYLLTYALINAVLGTVIGGVLWLIGMPNPVLWGFMVGILNFVPYLGPLVGVTIIGLVAFATFDTAGQAVLAPALYFSINALEGNLITPLIMGRRLQLNPVAIFLSLTFWGWIWGIAGALLAVPLLVTLKIICDNVITLRPIGEFIGR